MNLLSDIITYVRRIIKATVPTTISDGLIVDYINRFYTSDIPLRVQLFDLKTKYSFSTINGVDQYNLPYYTTTPNPLAGGTTIGSYPVYQGLIPPCYADGVQMVYYNQRDTFFRLYPNYIQNTIVGVGNGGKTYSINTINNLILRGNIDVLGQQLLTSQFDPFVTTYNTGVPTTSITPAVIITAIASNGSQQRVTDSGQFLVNNQNFGLLTGDIDSTNPWTTTNNTVNYSTGAIHVTFDDNIPSTSNIYVEYYFYQTGIPRLALFFNNTVTLRNVPDKPYFIEFNAYLTPAAFLSTSAAIPFGYMCEYIARGAARKILSDNGDVEQFQFYEPLFREQEMLVWKRAERIWTSTRTPTIFSDNQYQVGYSNIGQGT